MAKRQGISMSNGDIAEANERLEAIGDDRWIASVDQQKTIALEEKAARSKSDVGLHTCRVS